MPRDAPAGTNAGRVSHGRGYITEWNPEDRGDGLRNTCTSLMNSLPPSTTPLQGGARTFRAISRQRRLNAVVPPLSFVAAWALCSPFHFWTEGLGALPFGPETPSSSLLLKLSLTVKHAASGRPRVVISCVSADSEGVCPPAKGWVRARFVLFSWEGRWLCYLH